ncbi:Hypothetical_protein [Hexamita inflata]|uniref:Hypothetical_protein n=1 Tax=Hexamita inflata TaxID=28002 RepID=A0AA86UQI8_9EUKA|nr:Hypothetical protein HINF_LOCUS48286 [Hexamita inflata]
MSGQKERNNNNDVIVSLLYNEYQILIVSVYNDIYKLYHDSLEIECQRYNLIYQKERLLIFVDFKLHIKRTWVDDQVHSFSIQNSLVQAQPNRIDLINDFIEMTSQTTIFMNKQQGVFLAPQNV